MCTKIGKITEATSMHTYSLIIHIHLLMEQRYTTVFNQKKFNNTETW